MQTTSRERRGTSFRYAGYHFGQRDGCRCEGFEAQHRPHPPLDTPMIPPDPIVEVLVFANSDAFNARCDLSSKRLSALHQRSSQGENSSCQTRITATFAIQPSESPYQRDRVRKVLSTACSIEMSASNGRGAFSALGSRPSSTVGRLVINLSRMSKIIHFNAEDLNCTVQAGATREQVNQHLRDTGLFFAVDLGGVCI